MVTIDEQIASMQRDIAFRISLYTKRVKEGKMNPKDARREYNTMRAVLESLLSYSTMQEQFQKAKDLLLDADVLQEIREVRKTAWKDTLRIVMRQCAEYLRRIDTLERENRLLRRTYNRQQKQWAEDDEKLFYKKRYGTNPFGSEKTASTGNNDTSRVLLARNIQL